MISLPRVSTVLKRVRFRSVSLGFKGGDGNDLRSNRKPRVRN